MISKLQYSTIKHKLVYINVLFPQYKINTKAVEFLSKVEDKR